MRTVNLIQSFGKWRQYRETCIALDRLTGKQLSDIGMSREDIHTVARKAV